MQVRWEFESPMYDFKNSFYPDFVYIHRAKYIFSRFSQFFIPKKTLGARAPCAPPLPTACIEFHLPHYKIPQPLPCYIPLCEVRRTANVLPGA